jgi:hypothetical protein
VGGAVLLATLAGEYLMHNPAQAQDWHACVVSTCRSNNVIRYVPLPATSVLLPNGSMLGITLYQIIVLTFGVVIFASALACAARTTFARRIVLAVAAVLLALTLVVFHAQAPTQSLEFGRPVCAEICGDQQPRVVPYVPVQHVSFSSSGSHENASVPLIDSMWFMVPAAALGLLTTGIALLPVTRRRVAA